MVRPAGAGGPSLSHQEENLINIEQPVAVITALPFLANCDPHDRLLVAGVDDEGGVVTVDTFPMDAPRPLDDAAITITGLPGSASGVIVVAYTEQPSVDLDLLRRAADAAGRTVHTLLVAGQHRWRALDCSRPRCCPVVGNRYADSPAGHPVHRPIPEHGANPSRWRNAMWDEWQAVLRLGGPADHLQALRLTMSLFDIPLRDAVLAQSARDHGAARPALAEVMQQLRGRTLLGTAIPLHTCIAALHYLDGEITRTHDAVNAILAAEEYSLARLLRNGLDMRAPASLLARSFAHFDPLDLLAA